MSPSSSGANNPNQDLTIATALAEARSKGLPDTWTVRYDSRNRRKWISPKPDYKTYDSLPKALAAAKRQEKTAIQGGEGPAITVAKGVTKSSSKFQTNSKSNEKSSRNYRKRKLPSTDSISVSISSVSSSDNYSKRNQNKRKKSSSRPNNKKSTENQEPMETQIETEIEDTEIAVHWDPTGPEGKIVGYRFRLYNSQSDTWRPGRVLTHDPCSNLHKVRFYAVDNNDEKDSVSEVDGVDEWIRMKEEVVQCGSRFVWALVRGFAWWPAQVLIRDYDPPKDGYVFVEFFGSEQVATVKDSPEFIRPFKFGEIDSVIKKNKKKRNAKAIEVACEEQAATQTARNEAILSYAKKAFHAANKIAGGFLGRRIEIFRSDINYPAGSTVKGYIRHYSPTMKKWLVSYDSYSASWINFTLKEFSHKFIDKHNPNRTRTPSNLDLAPAIFGLESGNGKFNFLQTHCMACLVKVEGNQLNLQCHKCKSWYHPSCLDPPITNSRIIQKMIDSNWTCDKCSPCLGCHKFDIAFGTKPHQVPSSLALENGEKLVLCATCTPLYKRDRYCPNCGHCWDDVKYEKTQRSLKQKRKDIKSITGPSNDKSEGNLIGQPAKVDSTEESESLLSGSNSLTKSNMRANPLSTGLLARDPSWFFHDSTVWGFNEASMLACDSCSLWVHAGCANLSREEYELTNQGKHPVYSKEFLCRTCCKKRCISIITALQNEDDLLLFAVPVTEDVAPTYSDTIKNPMDLQTMMHRAQTESYFNYNWVRESFELIVLNALRFNRSYSKYWNEAKRYHEICMQKVFPKLAKAASPGMYTDLLKEEYVKAKREAEMEIERVQEDKNAEKKDLVGGAEVVNIKLEPLRSSAPDPISLVPIVDIHLKPVDAHYSAWLDSCFACGSCGASDTMLFCVDCGEAYHSFCVSAPIHSMSAAAAAAWRCPNCKICEITGELPEDETRMIYCDMCDRAFTLDLLDPPLESAPSGLWICGQCVSCDKCQNEDDVGGFSLKHWSQDPKLCYGCGGCDGLVDKYLEDMNCPVCLKLWRRDDSNLLHCQTCKHYVHKHCDSKGFNRYGQNQNPSGNKDEGRDFDDTKYECPRCMNIKNDESKNTLTFEFLRTQAEIALHMKDASTNLQHENASHLFQEIEFQILNLWRDEYQQIIQEGKRIFKLAQTKVGEHFDSESLSIADKCLDQRTSRWIRFMKRRPEYALDHKYNCQDEHICSLVLKAKNAAAFIKAASKHVGVRFPSTRFNFDVMNQLLIEYDENGIFTYPKRNFKLSQRDKDCANLMLKLIDGHMYLAQEHPNDTLSRPPQCISTPLKNEHPVKIEQPQNKKSSQDTNDHSKPNNISAPLKNEPLVKTEQAENNKLSQETEDDSEYNRIEKSYSSQDNDTTTKTVSKEKQPIMVRNVKLNSAQLLASKYVASPMHGWNGQLEHTQAEQDWRDPRMCCLCHTCGDDDAGLSNHFESDPEHKSDVSTFTHDQHQPQDNDSADLKKLAKSGRLLPLAGGLWVHTACALWSSEVWESDIGEINALDRARSRGSQLKCFGCGRPGATLGCHKVNCSFNYHYPCASACNGVLTITKQMYCYKHRDQAQDILRNRSFEPMKKLRVISDNEHEDGITEGNFCSRHGALVVHSLGAVEQSYDGFHSADYITPVGFTATRIFWSYRGIKKRTLYVLKVDRSPLGKPIFSITAADDANSRIQGHSMYEVFDALIYRVKTKNKECFHDGDEFSFLPVLRRLKTESFNLNAPQFFGFGIPFVRKAIENLPGVEAVVVPLSCNSESYRFCYKLLSEDNVKSFQRKRAGIAAEHALQNVSGSARTEGKGAVARSTGSGRITRALVRNVDEEIQINTVNESSSARTRKAIDDSNNDSSYQEMYREMKSVPLRERLAAMRSHIHGWGLFTLRDVPKNGMIIEYMGETVRQCIADKRERFYEMSGIGSCYMFRIDFQRIVDATRIGCMARFMNHCCRPNAYAKVIMVVGEEGPEKKIVVFALRNIVSGEEITYDYKFPVEDGSLRCTCGAPNCIGRMN